MTKTKAARARRLILRIEKLKATTKAQYEQMDTLASEVGKLVGSGARVPMNDNENAHVTDQFLDQEKDVLWGHGAVRRWKIEIKPAA